MLTPLKNHIENEEMYHETIQQKYKLKDLKKLKKIRGYKKIKLLLILSLI